MAIKIDVKKAFSTFLEGLVFWMLCPPLDLMPLLVLGLLPLGTQQDYLSPLVALFVVTLPVKGMSAPFPLAFLP